MGLAFACLALVLMMFNIFRLEAVVLDLEALRTPCYTMTSSFSLNIGNFIILRLTPTNYPLWREQALTLAESQDLVGHLTNDDPASPPPQYTTPNSNDTTTIENFCSKIN